MKRKPIDEFLDALHKNIADCIETGAEHMLILDVEERKIQIVISEAGKTPAAFLDLMGKAVKDAKIMIKGGQ